MCERFTLLAAGLMGFAAVLLGALGAHLLKDTIVDHGELENFQLAKEYCFYHALALGAIAIQLRVAPSRCAKFAAAAFLLGSVAFQGSLVVLSLTGWRAIVYVTPFGGILLMAGWLCWACSGCCVAACGKRTEDDS